MSNEFDIPAISQSVDPAIRNPFNRMREAIQTLLGTRGDGSRAALTLANGGGGGTTVIVAPGGGGGGGGGVTPDLTPPPTLTGLAAVAGFTEVIVSWDAATYTQGHGHGQTNIYAVKRAIGGPLPTFADAQQVYQATGALTIAAIPSELNTRWHIWAKWQTADGVESAAPAGGVNGVTVTTGQDITQLLSVLTGQITASQLFAALGARIDLVDGSGPGSVNDRIQTLQASVTGAGGNLVPSSGFELDSDGDGLADGWTKFVGGAGDGARIVVTSLIGGLTGQGKAQRLSISSVGNSQDSGVLNLTQMALKPNTTYTVSMQVRSNSTAAYLMLRTLNSALFGVADFPSATIPVANITKRLTVTFTTGATVAFGEIQVRGINAPGQFIECDDAMVQIGSLATPYVPSVSDVANLTVSLQTEATARASADGSLFAQYTVKIDSNGYVSGYGLASTSTGAAPTSSFIVRADSFAISAPTGPGITPATPFIVRTTVTTENGVTVPIGVYMDSAYIVNVSALYGRFGTLVADSIAAGQINAANLTLGSGAIGGNLRSTSYTPGAVGWVIRPDGFAEFSNVAIRGASYSGSVISGSGSIGGITINLHDLRSSNYVPATAGFRINDDGSAEFYNVTARGNITANSLNAATGTFGAVTIAAGGSLSSGQSAFNTGTGFWWGLVSGVPKFSIGTAGGASMTWDGTTLNVNQPTLDTFTASIPSGNMVIGGSFPAPSGTATYGTRTVSVSGGRAPYTYSWVINCGANSAGVPWNVWVSAGSTASATVSVAGNGDGVTNYARAICFVQDSNGRLTMATFSITALHQFGGGGAGGGDSP